MTDGVRLREFTDSDLPVLLRFTADEGWRYSETDCRAQLTVDPRGITLAEDASGQHLGFIGHFTLSKGMSYLDVFITRKDVRGKGFGKLLWQEMLRKTESKVRVLDGLPEVVPWYKTQGFTHVWYRQHVYTGSVPDITKTDAMKPTHDISVQALSDKDWPQLIEYDRQVYSYDREAMLRAQFNPERSFTFLVWKEGRLTGFANAHRRTGSAYNIRTLCADNQETADALLEALLDSMSPGDNVLLSIIDGKVLPKCLEHFQHVYQVDRLSTEVVELSNMDKIYFTNTHMM